MDLKSGLWYGVLISITAAYLVAMAGVRSAKQHEVSGEDERSASVTDEGLDEKSEAEDEDEIFHQAAAAGDADFVVKIEEVKAGDYRCGDKSDAGQGVLFGDEKPEIKFPEAAPCRNHPGGSQERSEQNNDVTC